MRHKIRPLTRRAFSLSLLSLLLLGLVLPGCGGGGGKKNPVGPGPVENADFSQAEATTQAQAAGSQAVALVESIRSLAGGVSKRYDGAYGWNAEANRWEYHYLYDQMGSSYDWLYTVRYLDSQGQPQEFATNAARVDHTMTGIGSYHSESQGTVVDYHYQYTYDVGITGLGGQSYAMGGQGGWGIDFTYVYNGQTYASHYVVAWSTLNEGVAVPAANGYPTGTIRYDFAPYYMIVAFNGTQTALGTLHTRGGGVVAGSTRTYTLRSAS